jgi:poly(beta-D-mannuronate) lyase
MTGSVTDCGDMAGEQQMSERARSRPPTAGHPQSRSNSVFLLSAVQVQSGTSPVTRRNGSSAFVTIAGWLPATLGRMGAMVLVAMLGSHNAGAKVPLRAPFDVAALRAVHGVPIAGTRCPPPPAPVHDVLGVSFYTDPQNSVPDPGRLALDNQRQRPVRDFLVGVEDSAIQWVQSEPPLRSKASCALSWLDNWARADAMLGQVNQQGSYERKWTLGGVALSWLEIRGAPGLDATAVSRVLAWLKRLAAAVQPPYDRPPRPGLSTVLNNHAYWAGMSVAAVGIAVDDRAMFDWGVQRLRIGLGQINADGALPLELARGRLALHYHLFALQPLLVLNEMAHANGIDMESDGKLAQLVHLSFAGARDRSVFTRLAGVQQSGFSGAEEADEMVEGAAFEVWLVRHPDPAVAGAIAPHRPFNVPWLGGNVTLLYGR